MTIEAGSPAPPFTLPALDGGELSLPGDAGGLPVLLAFFRVSCDTCDMAFPYINRLREAYRDGWHLWAVSQDAAERAAAYRDRFAITCSVLIDAPALAISRIYDPPSTPTLVLIGPEGSVEYVSEGFAKDDLNEISVRLAARLGLAAVEVAPIDDGNPAMKPGCMARHLFPPRR
ncbi:MAG TPA: TlpA disulfide reductase family protein [Dehalococcoidia bacterium]